MSKTPTMKTHRRDVGFLLKLTPAEKQALKQAAFERDLTLNQLVRGAVRRAITDGDPLCPHGQPVAQQEPKR